MNFQATVDLTNCDREPIHILGAIQPIGFLLALTADWMVARASANFAEFIGLDATDLIGRPLPRSSSAEAIHDLRNRVACCAAPTRSSGFRLRAGARIDHPFDVAIHFSGGQVVIEAEPAPSEHGDAPAWSAR